MQTALKSNKDITSGPNAIKVNIALSTIIQNIQPISTEKVDIRESLDRILARPIAIGSGYISSGTLLASHHLGILSGLGRTHLEVRRRPKVAILSIDDSNIHTVLNQIQKCGCDPKAVTIPRQKPEILEKSIMDILDCDLILALGGSRPGGQDLVKFVLLKMGTDIKFYEVLMEPGRSLIFGFIKEIPVMGLSDNLIDEVISFEIFVRPLILKMLDQKNNLRKEVDAVLEEGVRKKEGIMYCLFGHTRWEEGLYFTKIIEPLEETTIKSLVLANSLIILPEEVSDVEKGVRVRVIFLD